MRRLVNHVSVVASFFKRMSAEENLSYAARFYGLTPGVTAVRIPEILERVGFPVVRASGRMEDLSRGMQHKVALVRALLTSPVLLLLLDEPTTGLDPRSKREVQPVIRDLRAAQDTTFPLCTHDLSEVERWRPRRHPPRRPPAGARPVIPARRLRRLLPVSVLPHWMHWRRRRFIRAAQ